MEIETINFDEVYKGSFYTIICIGGKLYEWIEHYERLLQKEKIGIPKNCYTYLGSELNGKYDLKNENLFSDSLTFLSFNLEGLDITKLAKFKIFSGDRWFNDIINNPVN